MCVCVCARHISWTCVPRLFHVYKHVHITILSEYAFQMYEIPKKSLLRFSTNKFFVQKTYLFDIFMEILTSFAR